MADLAVQARADVDAMLRPGERLLWSAPHDARKTMRQMRLVLGVVFLLFAVLIAILVPMKPLWLPPAILFGLFTPIFALGSWSARMTRKKCYAITDQSVVIIRRDPLGVADVESVFRLMRQSRS